VSGILLGIIFPDLISPGRLVGIVLALSVLFVLQKVLFFRSINGGIIGLPLLLFVGYAIVFFRNESNSADHIINETEPILYYEINVVSYPEERQNSWKQVAVVTGIRTAGGYKKKSGKVLLYFDKSDFPDPFSYGAVLLIKGRPQLVSPPSNPHEFDYRKYLSFRNIYHQQFLRDKNVLPVGHQPKNTLLGWAIAARQKSVATLKNYVNGERERAIASALVLGVTDGLDDSLLQAYASSGAIHVLAVSGLHVGILYAVIVFLFRPFRHYPKNKWILAFVSIACLWGYAFVTGLSPSVLRAVTMFTFVAIAQPLERRSDIYNTIALSAFCLLLYDPFLIMSVGFQLSYLAVLGIVYLYPRFFFLWTPPPVITPVWKITCVSLSAQLATFPLGLFYFHQFPVYFLVANLFVIPLSFVVLIGGLSLLGLSLLVPVAEVVGYALTNVIKLMNSGVLLTERLPGSLIESVHINSFQCWLLIVMVLCIVLLFQLRKLWTVYLAMISVLSFSGLQWYHWGQRQKDQFIVYNIHGQLVADITRKGFAYQLGHSDLNRSPDMSVYQTQGNRLTRGVRALLNIDDYPFVHKLKGCKLIAWNNTVGLHISEAEFTFSRKHPVDFVLISFDAVKNLDEVVGKVSFEQIIMDSSNSWEVVDRMSNQSRAKDIIFHAVAREGAYIKEL
jgi:competence protein ComEC